MIGGPETHPIRVAAEHRPVIAYLIRTFSGGTLHAREVPNRRKTAEEEKASVRIGQIVSCSKLTSIPTGITPYSELYTEFKIESNEITAGRIPQSPLCSDLPLL
jgi:hypothetical protein